MHNSLSVWKALNEYTCNFLCWVDPGELLRTCTFVCALPIPVEWSKSKKKLLGWEYWFISKGRGDAKALTQHLSQVDWCPAALRPPCAHMLIADHDVTWQGISLWYSITVICPGCLCSQHLVHQATSLRQGKWRKSWDCAGTNQQEPQHCCVTDTIPATKPKHSTSGAAVTEVKSIVVRPFCWRSQQSPVLQWVTQLFMSHFL